MLSLAVGSIDGTVVETMDGHAKSLYSGVVMTEEVLKKIFSRHGLAQIKPEGELFDPNLHEAVFEVPAEQVGLITLPTEGCVH